MLCSASSVHGLCKPVGLAPVMLRQPLGKLYAASSIHCCVPAADAQHLPISQVSQPAESSNGVQFGAGLPASCLHCTHLICIGASLPLVTAAASRG